MPFIVRKSGSLAHLVQSLFSAALVAVFLLASAWTTFAQSAATGAIGGVISDTGGAPLPAASVTVKSAETGYTRTIKSNSSGEYRVPELEPGTYTATFTADGFQTSQVTSVIVTVGGLSPVSPQLKVGSVSEQVEVTDTSALLHTESNEISTTIDQNAIDNLPINGRRWSDFAVLTPGVVSNSDGFGLLSFRGISYLLNNSTVDGADDNQAYFSEARGRTRSAYTVSQGAVQEFQVNTSNYSAEYGRAAGGVTNTVTKSGTNKMHGELFFYDRDNALGGAVNPYTLLTNQDSNGKFVQFPYKPKDWRKQWGLAMGGPILRDKIFWFYGYDQSKRNFPGTARTSDPIDLLAQASPISGEKCTTNNAANAYGAPSFTYINSAGKSVTAAVTDNLTGGTYPVGASYQGNFGACALAATLNVSYQAATSYYNQGLQILNSFLGAVPRTGDQVINFPKIDWQINDKNRATVQYNRLRWDSPAGVQTQSSNFYGRGSFGNDFVKADVAIFRLSTVLTNSIVNSFTSQYGRDMETETPQAPTANELPLVTPLPAGECSAPHGKPCAIVPSDISIGYGYDSSGFDIGTNPILARFALPDERRMQGKDDVSWSYGKHIMKFGLDYNQVSDYINNLYNGYGTFNEDWAYSFIGDYLNKTTKLGTTATTYGANASASKGAYYNYSQAFGRPDALITTREYAGYATDDWRILPNLTLTLGVRYEYEYVPTNPTPNPVLPQTYNRPDDRNNVGPRIGFTYNIYGNNKTILRGGYGMYYGRIINSNVLQSYQNSGGPGSQINYSSIYSDGACAPSFGSILASASAASCALNPIVSYLDSHLQNPQVHEVDLALEQDLGHNLVLGITYMSSFGRELDSSVDTNVTRAGAVITKFKVDNTPVASPNSTGYITLPHGGKPAPLVDGSEHSVLVFTKNSRINPSYGNILRIASNVNSNYNALAFQLNKRYSSGLSMLANYTWSHALDYNPYIGTGVPTFNVLDPTDLSKEYGNSSLDVRSRFVFAATYQPQTHFHGAKDSLLGGWRIAPIIQAQSGMPFTSTVSGYPTNTVSSFRGIAGTGASANRIDDIRRNQQHRPNTVKADLRLSKNFYFDVGRYGFERVRFELLGEIFNIANHQNITGVTTGAYQVGTTTNSDGSQILKYQAAYGTYTNSNSNYTYSPRQVQLAARLHF